MADEGDEVLKPILLRSSTPAPNEKVLKYLEGMKGQDSFDNGSAISARTSKGSKVSKASKGTKPRSKAGSNLIVSPGRPSGATTDELNGSEMNYTGMHGKQDDDGAASDVQEAHRSDDGTERGLHEPGPNDLPGPKYKSYDTQESWGNKGPFPETTNGGWQNQYARVPLPESVASPPHVAVNIISPTNEASVRSQRDSPSASEKDVRSTTTEKAAPRKEKSQASKATTTRREEPPRSTVSTARGEDYPGSPTKSHHRKAPSVAASLAPSDSTSQIGSPRYKEKQAAASAHAQSRMASPQPMSPKSPSKHVDARSAASAQQHARSATSGHQPTPERAFSPYRHAPTNEDLFHAMAQAASPPKSPSPRPKEPSVVSAQSSPSKVSSRREGSKHSHSHSHAHGVPAQPRSPSPNALNDDEARIVRETLGRASHRTSYAASALEPDVANSHFHDMDLCVLLHQEQDPGVHDVVKKALRKAVRQRVKKLGLKDPESIKQYRQSFHNHDPSVHLQPNYSPQFPEEPPAWARDLMETMATMQEHIQGLGPKIERLKSSRSRSYIPDSNSKVNDYDDEDRYSRTPTQTVNIQTAQPTGDETEIIEGSTRGFESTTNGGRTHGGLTKTHTHGAMSDLGRDDSPGQQYLEEELYKLIARPGGSQSGTHRTWELKGEGDMDEDEEEEDNGEAYTEVHREYTETGMEEIPDGTTHTRPSSPPLPALPPPSDVQTAPQAVQTYEESETDTPPQPPWTRIFARLLRWAIIWPMTEIEIALNSTTRGHQIDEIALTIWSTQCYKRYVRSKMTDVPGGRVDRLFVPPNMADAISNAVFNGRHGDASAMLRDLWSPFGLEGIPRLLVVLAKHRTDPNHWVVHKFSLPEGALTTYDSFPERTLPDGRPLGWWFAIRVAWPNAIYPSPDHLMQKMVRLHRPMQLGIDNAVAAAGIWRNVLMGSRAERSLDLERLRDLINTEVKNLRTRKTQGKLSVTSPRNWEQDLH